MSAPSSWLAGLPEHWARRSLGRECWVRARLGWKGLKAEEYVDSGGYPMLATPDIKGSQIEFAAAARISEARFAESPEIMLRRGDVLLTKDGSTIGTLNLVRQLPEPATVNGSIAVLTPSRRLHGPFLYYVLASRYADAVFRYLTDGAGVPHLFQRDINKIAIPMPPLDEQRRIADFLDAETAQIDALIAEQERFIALLRERREAVVARAVQPSSVEPRALKRIIMADRPLTYGIVQAGENVADGVPYIGPSDMNSDDGVPELQDLRRTSPEIAAAYRRSTVVAGDIVVSIGPAFGKVMIVPDVLDGSNLTQDTARVACDPSLAINRYIEWALRSRAAWRFWDRAITGATFRRLNLATLAETPVHVPGLAEQKRIVRYLDEQTARIDSLVHEAEHNIALSKERRSALITAAVTGQIDVTTGRAV